MNGIYNPIKSDIDVHCDDNDKIMLSAAAGNWLGNMWDVEEGTIQVLNSSILTTNNSKVYRVGNIGILQVYVRKATDYIGTTWHDVLKLPWRPIAATREQRITGYISTNTPLWMYCGTIIREDGTVSIYQRYHRNQNYLAIIPFVIAGEATEG